MVRQGWLVRRSVAAIVLAGTGAAHAEALQDAEAAQKLFQSGLDDMLAGRYQTGCPALSESMRLDPRPGTLFTLAECESQAGRIATAVARYGEYLRLFAAMDEGQQKAQRGRDVVAAKQLAALTPEVPKLTLLLPPDAPAGTQVVRDGQPIEPSMLGVALSIDPGEHVVSTLAPGRESHELKVTMARREEKRVVVGLGAATTAQSAVAPAPEEQEPADDGAVVGTAGWIVGGVGVLGVAMGAITGAMAMSAFGDAEDNCEGTSCNQDGLDAVDRTRPLGDASTACFVIGSAALVAGVLMILLAPDDADAEAEQPAAEVSIRPWVGGTEAASALVGLSAAW